MADVLIRGMEMPRRREEVFLFAVDSDGKVYGWDSEELPRLKAIAIPDHGRLIDADEFVSCMTELVQIAKADGFDLGVAWYTAFIRHIELAPTVIPASEEVKNNA